MRKLIYLAEDSAAHQKIALTALGGSKLYDIEVFNDGMSAYLQVFKKMPDMVVTDLIMPGLSGLALARLLKFHERTQHLPVLAMSSITDGDIAERAEDVGIDVFLPKPYRMDTLAAKVEELLLGEPDIDPERLAILHEFLAESHRDLNAIGPILMDWNGAQPADEELAVLRRAFHTMKGTSGFLGLDHLSSLAKEAEHEIDAVREFRVGDPSAVGHWLRERVQEVTAELAKIEPSVN